MLFSLYRRHTKTCSVHENKKMSASAKRIFMDCDCPLWVYGTSHGQKLERQSVGTNILSEAQAQIRSIDHEHIDQKLSGFTLEHCIETYLESRKHEISEKSLLARGSDSPESSAASRPAISRRKASCSQALFRNSAR